MSARDPMTELAVTLDQLIVAVKVLTVKLDKLQDEKVQVLSEQMARADERLKATEDIAKVAKAKAETIDTAFSMESATQKEKVEKLERFFYGLVVFVFIQLVGLAIWLLKK
jgi:CRISPR/Cas system-associated endonuclease Cas3-HD